ncbi:MAG: carbohydrate kinase, partial [Jatrophihabitantaceae bacterium]|nr:carbohydrate kinase [Jatrophihabitantaceae bacterium]
PDSAAVVLDAFALGSLPGVGTAVDRLAGRMVLTPNMAELARLAGTDEDAIDDVRSVVAAAAAQYSCVVSCHGIVVDADGSCYEIGAGHVGLGTSGSGDVLAGAIAGLLARGADPVQAACWGTYLHAAAGDRLAARVGRLGFIARELLDEIPLVLTELAA